MVHVKTEVTQMMAPKLSKSLWEQILIFLSALLVEGGVHAGVVVQPV